MINSSQVEEIRSLLDASTNPVILHDDDVDGVTSFALIYKYFGKAKHFFVKSSPIVRSEVFLDKVLRQSPDLVIILDKPLVEDEFLEGLNCKIIWIDHHDIPENSNKKNLYYYNPKQHSDEYSSTATQCFEVVKKKNPENLWIAVTGAISDCEYPKHLIKEFQKKYPGLLDPKIKTAPKALFESKVGDLSRCILFNLKGKTSDVKISLNVLTKIESPNEILKSETPKGKLLFKKFEKLDKKYKIARKLIFKNVDDSPFLISVLRNQQISFTSELSNEAIFTYPKKIIIIGRFSDGRAKCSVRTTLDFDISPILQEALSGLDGYGGGHKNACGMSINENDFEIFLERFKEIVLEKLN